MKSNNIQNMPKDGQENNSIKQNVSSSLRKGTTKCPICKQPLHFEIMGTMRIVRDDKYSAYCPTDVRYFDVVAN